MRHTVHLGIMILVSILIVAGVIYAVGAEKTLHAVERAGFTSFAAIGALTLAFLLAQTLAWVILSRPVRHKVGFLTLLEGSVVALAGNVVTPSSHVGGEPLKILYVARVAHLRHREVTGTVVLCKYLEAVALILIIAVSAALATVRFHDALFSPEYLAVGISLLTVAGAVVGFGVVLLISLWKRWRPLTLMMTKLGGLRFLRGKLSRYVDWMRDMEDQVSRVFHDEQRASWQAFAALALADLILFVKPLFFFYLGTRITLNLGELSLLFVVSQCLLAVQFTPLGAGTLDGGLLGAFALMGQGDTNSLAACTAFLLALRFWDIITIGIGALIASRAGSRFLFTKPEPIIGPNQTPPTTGQ